MAMSRFLTSSPFSSTARSYVRGRRAKQKGASFTKTAVSSATRPAYATVPVPDKLLKHVKTSSRPATPTTSPLAPITRVVSGSTPRRPLKAKNTFGQSPLRDGSTPRFLMTTFASPSSHHQDTKSSSSSRKVDAALDPNASSTSPRTNIQSNGSLLMTPSSTTATSNKLSHTAVKAPDQSAVAHLIRPIPPPPRPEPTSAPPTPLSIAEKITPPTFTPLPPARPGEVVHTNRAPRLKPAASMTLIPSTTTVTEQPEITRVLAASPLASFSSQALSPPVLDRVSPLTTTPSPLREHTTITHWSNGETHYRFTPLAADNKNVPIVRTTSTAPPPAWIRTAQRPLTVTSSMVMSPPPPDHPTFQRSVSPVSRGLPYITRQTSGRYQIPPRSPATPKQSGITFNPYESHEQPIPTIQLNVATPPDIVYEAEVRRRRRWRTNSPQQEGQSTLPPPPRNYADDEMSLRDIVLGFQPPQDRTGDYEGLPDIPKIVGHNKKPMKIPKNLELDSFSGYLVPSADAHQFGIRPRRNNPFCVQC
eukprot:Blabericola_migrator_1__5124@NODE_264_length_10634_cov_183_258446_g220_i0_p1_GENE_NODE_264_length_10634_cov_183_258446_g220_i0NODE_264_length_10634_cov_183_258446_g220_i0_p1_ORF_typecomplete_len533_score53_27_NODE_264_length_10634_cov_183_258446_g220_i028674465